MKLSYTKLDLLSNDINVGLVKIIDDVHVVYQVYVGSNINIIFNDIHIVKNENLYKCSEQQYKDLMRDYEHNLYESIFLTIKNLEVYRVVSYDPDEII